MLYRPPLRSRDARSARWRSPPRARRRPGASPPPPRSQSSPVRGEYDKGRRKAWRGAQRAISIHATIDTMITPIHFLEPAFHSSPWTQRLVVWIDSPAKVSSFQPSLTWLCEIIPSRTSRHKRPGSVKATPILPIEILEVKWGYAKLGTVTAGADNTIWLLDTIVQSQAFTTDGLWVLITQRSWTRKTHQLHIHKQTCN